MTRNAIGFSAIVLGMILFIIAGHLGSQMRQDVNKVFPSTADNLLRNFYETFSTKRVRREYARLFPLRAKGKILWANITACAGLVLFIAGIFLMS
jgi:hypothetical protein